MFSIRVNRFCCSLVSSQMLDEQHKGMGIVPKLALDVMSCEVVRLLQLTKSSVVPLSYCVPRRVISEQNSTSISVLFCGGVMVRSLILQPLYFIELHCIVV